jgi:malonyl CoA-acyl carrier protein transacylase
VGAENLRHAEVPPGESGELPVPVLETGVVPWVVSGRSAEGLAAQARRLGEFVARRASMDAGDVGWSLAVTRSVFEHRAVIVGPDTAALAAGLAAVAAGEPAAGLVTGMVAPDGPGRVVFVFPGQGAQWAGMGSELAACSPVFAARLAECEQALEPYVGWSVRDVIDQVPGAPELEAAEVVQPALWAVMVSLAALWQAAGVRPDAVVGHSQGEISAACVAGMLTLPDAARVVALRSRALSRLGGQGGMISVVMPAAAVTDLLGRWGARLSVAAVNGPAATVVSGELAALAEFEAELAARHVLRWRIPVTDFVAHSARVRDLAGVLDRELAPIRPVAGQVPMYSTAQSRWLRGTELDAGYWYANVRNTVRFADAVTALTRTGHRTFIEVSPHPVLEAAIADTVEDTVLTGRWLVLAPAPAEAAVLAEACAAALAARGAEVITSQAGPGHTDRAALAEHISQVLRHGDGRAAPVSGVVSLLALDETPVTGFPAVSVGLAGTQLLVQALGDAGISAPLWVLTSGAVAAEPGEKLPRPMQAQAWGLSRAAGLEHPDRWGGLIDVPPVLDERAAERLCAVLAGCGEDQVAIRGAGILGLRLARAPQPRPGRTWQPRGSVLITGGTGAIAGHVARWLAGRGAPRLILTSRTGPAAPGAAALAADLAARGTTVQILACDITARPKLAALLARTAAVGPPLTAIMHTAGVLDDGVVDRLDTGRLAAVLAAKATGAACLDELTAGLDLDAFVLFSSIAGTFGGAGQGNYAAANAYLDALAQHRTATGRPGLSVAWGPWDGAGVGSNEAARKRVRRSRGEMLMDPDLAVRALGEALDNRDSLLAIMNVDWGLLASAPGAGDLRQVPLVRDLPEVRQLVPASRHGAGDGGVDQEGELARRLADLPPVEQDQMLITVIRANVAVVLDYASTDAVDPSWAFSDMGFDSLTAVELRNRINAATGLRLPSTAVFDYPAPAALAQQIRAEMSAAGRLSGTDNPQDGDNKKDNGYRYVASADALSVHEPASSFISGLCEQAVRTGRAVEIGQLVKGLATFRPVFEGLSDLQNIPHPVVISRGPASPSMICLPSFIGRSGPLEYACLVGSFRGIREVSVLSAPGYVDGEPLPATVGALIGVHAENIRRTVNGRPFVLAGHSTGGLVVQALATHLESVGMAPMALVLMDTATTERMEELDKFHAMLPDIILADNRQYSGGGEDSWLTAMAHYQSLGWEILNHTAIPTLLVRAQERIGASPGSEERRLSWAFSSQVTVVDVPGIISR